MPGPRSVLPIALWACGLLLAPGGLPAQAAAGPRNEPGLPAGPPQLTAKFHAYFTSAAGMLDPRPQEVPRSIPNRARQKTERYRRAMTELRRVKRTFAALNPGYVLVADTNGRSLRAQVAYWNRERSVAGTSSATIDSVLDRGGWGERLRLAVTQASSDFAGPMETPREPWHYEYRPETKHQQ